MSADCINWATPDEEIVPASNAMTMTELFGFPRHLTDPTVLGVHKHVVVRHCRLVDKSHVAQPIRKHLGKIYAISLEDEVRTESGVQPDPDVSTLDDIA